MKDNNQKYLVLLLLLGGGYFVYKKFSDKPDVKKPDDKPSGGDPSAGGTGTGNPPSKFDPIAVAKVDPEFKEYATHLQQVLNIILGQMGKSPIKVDGFIGTNTYTAIREVMGDRYIPIVSKSGLKWLVGELDKMKNNPQLSNNYAKLSPTDVAARITQAKKIAQAMAKINPTNRWFTWVDKDATLTTYEKDLLGQYNKEGGLKVVKDAKIQATAWQVLDTGFLRVFTKLPSGKMRYVYISPYSVTIYY
jgi:hypothetical protein